MNSSLKLVFGVVAAIALFVLANSFFIVQMTQHAIVLRFGQVVREPISEPGLYFKVPFIENVVTVDKRILDLDLPVQTVLSTDRQNLDVDAFARYRITQPLRFFQTVRTIPNANTRLASFVNSSMRNIIAGATMAQLIRTDRDRLMNRIQEEVNREATTLGVAIVDLRLTRVDLPQVNQEAVFNRMQTERRQEAADLRATGQQAAVTIRARADREVVGILAEADRRSEELRGAGDAERNKIFAEAFNRDPDFFSFYRTMQAYEQSLKQSDTRMVLSPNSEFFRYFGDPAGRRNGPRPPAPGTPATPPTGN
ncbi:protease modulator HflC [Phreatobacter cathodiphilus]|uniref:Protein HflC n=1 Tax=Phreatobacter cathodiphilus TaxID=1868589 RepID=A0A2S0N6U7_9HYPH|nr:protease modulator HflC [Phreatobacter cathodiphilus]AVO43661.1 protease modulator HflC [Phreatobacter cathodiphilus]